MKPIAPTESDDSARATALRGFGPIGLLALVFILLGNGLFVPLSALLVLAWARFSNTPLRSLGFRRPKSWIAVLALGIVFGAATKLLFKSVLMPALGAPPVNAQFAHLTGNIQALPFMLAWILVGAGFGEETVYRGFLFDRLRALLGARRGTGFVRVAVSSLAFAAVHLSSQGIYGAAQALCLGTLLGVVYLRTGSLWLPMTLHATFDMTALFLIYTGMERHVATFFIA